MIANYRQLDKQYCYLAFICDLTAVVIVCIRMMYSVASLVGHCMAVRVGKFSVDTSYTLLHDCWPDVSAFTHS